MISHSRFIISVALLLSLGGQASAQEVLPRTLRFMQAAAEVPFEPLQTKASEHGFDCLAPALFTYDNSALATQSVNEWLKMNGLQAQTVDSSPGLVQWKATGSGNTDLYAMWEATSGGGKLWMCSGTDHAAQARRDEQAAQASRSGSGSPQREETLATDEAPPSHTRLRIPLWAIIALGSAVAGGATRSIHKNPFSPDE